MPVSPQWPLSLSFFHQNPVHASPLPFRATYPALLFLLDFIYVIKKKRVWLWLFGEVIENCETLHVG
jgi:hypothetical protein